MENYAACALKFACCGLRHTLPQAAAQAAARAAARAAAQAAARANTQHASEIAENSVALLVEIQSKLKYVQLGKV